ncbi:uncharacterized protein V6R79_013050, partial [Siganus canaliculatus]
VLFLLGPQRQQGISSAGMRMHLIKTRSEKSQRFRVCEESKPLDECVQQNAFYCSIADECKPALRVSSSHRLI